MDILLLISVAVFAGFLGGKFSKRLQLPSVVGCIIMGMMMGPSLLNIFTLNTVDRMGLISDLTLGIVAFSIGNEMRFGVLKRLGMGIIIIIIAETLGAFLAVGLGIYLLTHKLYLALIFGALAPASAPAGTWVVLREYKAKGPLTETVLAVVGLDDAFAIVIYGLAAGVARVLLEKGQTVSFKNALETPILEIGGSIIMGLLFGILILYFLRGAKEKGEILTVTIAGILGCTGLANVLGLSLILSNMIFGVVISNIFLTSRKVMDAIEKITPPIYILFFILAGAHLQVKLLPQMGLLGIIYIAGRTSGLLGGAYIGATLAKAESNVRKYLGLTILSQAGVAIGLAMLVGREFGSIGITGKYLALLAINTIAATTIIFEIIGPVTTKIAIIKAGEAGRRIRREDGTFDNRP